MPHNFHMGLFRLFTILALLVPLTSQAVIVNRVTEFEPHTKATAEDLNDEFDNIISAINGNLGPENFLVGSIASQNIVNGAITTDKIATGAVTSIKLAAATVSNSDDVTYSTDNTSFVAVTSLFATINTTGRPVHVRLAQGDAFPLSETGTIKTSGGGTPGGVLMFRLNGSANYYVPIEGTQELPCSAASFIDVPSSGANLYEVLVKNSVDGDFEIINCRLQLMEF
jgi:hypothetical protein